ncbi:hypothetical protein NBRC116597_28390 [Phaeobacter sp. NW0010-22]
MTRKEIFTDDALIGGEHWGYTGSEGFYPIARGMIPRVWAARVAALRKNRGVFTAHFFGNDNLCCCEER